MASMVCRCKLNCPARSGDRDFIFVFFRNAPSDLFLIIGSSTSTFLFSFLSIYILEMFIGRRSRELDVTTWITLKGRAGFHKSSGSF